MIEGFRFILIAFLTVFTLNPADAQTEFEESHNKVSMRMIGHQVLLSQGDSTSRVLPIKKEGGKYKIEFATEFAFDPEDLGIAIHSVVKERHIANHYIVEVVDCATNEVVYSYEIIDVNQEMLPCEGRLQPKGCYMILVSMLEVSPVEFETSGISMENNAFLQYANSNKNAGLILLLFLFGTIAFVWKKNQRAKGGSNLIPIGNYKFDQRNMELVHKNERVELTSKEADLLFLLYSSANSTVERELILKNVWGDQGDYVGRTLDVFISKLRKKLEADTNVKIINIRGVGYKLILSEVA
ncbi:winged helix-turn-helix domain-containing protein [Peijinzhouia sedimentorum]